MSKDDPLFMTQSRREMLIKTAAATFAATGLSTPGVLFAQNLTTLSPGQTEGPYWVDGMPNRQDIRTNTSNGAFQQGLKFQLMVNVSQLVSGTVVPINSAKVDLWHCNWNGVYSAVAAQGTTGQNYFRGYQMTDGHGNVRFASCYPGYYNGRTVHIHFRVRRYSGATVTYNLVSQFYASDGVSTFVFNNNAPYNTRPARTTFNSNDMVYTGPSQGTGGTVTSNSGAQLLLRLDAKTGHAIGSFNVVI